MSIRFSNGVLERLLCAVMLRKFYGRNRARNVLEQSHGLRMNHAKIMLKLIEHNDAEGEYGSYHGTNLQ